MVLVVVRMDFKYDEESEYGQALLNLLGLIGLLQDEEKTYNSMEVHDTLSEIAAEALRIRRQVDRSARAYDEHKFHTA